MTLADLAALYRAFNDTQEALQRTTDRAEAERALDQMELIIEHVRRSPGG